MRRRQRGRGTRRCALWRCAARARAPAGESTRSASRGLATKNEAKQSKTIRWKMLGTVCENARQPRVIEVHHLLQQSVDGAAHVERRIRSKVSDVDGRIRWDIWCRCCCWCCRCSHRGRRAVIGGRVRVGDLREEWVRHTARLGRGEVEDLQLAKVLWQRHRLGEARQVHVAHKTRSCQEKMNFLVAFWKEFWKDNIRSKRVRSYCCAYAQLPCTPLSVRPLPTTRTGASWSPTR